MVKSEIHRDTKILHKIQHFTVKVKKSETQGNSQKRDSKTYHKCHSEILRLNEVLRRSAVFQVPFATPNSLTS